MDLTELITKIKTPKTIFPTKIDIKPRMMSQVSKERLFNLANQCSKFKDNKDVSFVECGIGNGGCLAVMKYIINEQQIYGFDSFETLPNITERDVEKLSPAQQKNHPTISVGKLMGSLDNVKHTFDLLDLSMENVNIVIGYVQNTLPKYKDIVKNIAILRLDCDWYEATKLCLEQLYDNVIEGGVIIIDDYGCFKGCQIAVNEFRKNNNITSELYETDYTERYWYK